MAYIKTKWRNNASPSIDAKNLNKIEDQLALTETRVDQIARTPGGTTGDAELADIRIGADGKTYANAGTAVREQFNEVNESLENIEVIQQEVTDLGYYKRVDFDGTVYVGAEDDIKANDAFYFRPLAVPEEKTGITLYGMYGQFQSEGYDTLVNNGVVGKTYKITPTREYHHIQAVCAPYVSGQQNAFSFGYVQPKIGVLTDIEDVKEGVDNAAFRSVKKLVKISVNLNTENHSIEISHNGVGNACIIFTDSKYIFPNASAPSTNINYAPFVGSGSTIALVWDELAKNYAIRKFNTELAKTDIMIAFWFIGSDFKVQNNIAYAYCNDVYIDGHVIDETTDDVVKTLNRTTCKIFQKVICCGDSYTAGYIHVGDITRVNEDYAYPHYMSTLTGNEWINCGASGCNVLTWQTDMRGLSYARSYGKAQAYVIGLMINDVSADRGVPLGTVADIGTDAQTYYGGMSKIIRELNAISPNAKIFVNTCPKTGGKFAEYNEAVRNIVNAYKGIYPVHCIDLEAVKELYNNSSLTGDYINGHYTAIGYEQFAEIYSYVLSNYINTHIADFQDIHKIELD